MPRETIARSSRTEKAIATTYCCCWLRTFFLNDEIEIDSTPRGLSENVFIQQCFHSRRISALYHHVVPGNKYKLPKIYEPFDVHTTALTGIIFPTRVTNLAKVNNLAGDIIPFDLRVRPRARFIFPTRDTNVARNIITVWFTH